MYVMWPRILESLGKFRVTFAASFSLLLAPAIRFMTRRSKINPQRPCFWCRSQNACSCSEPTNSDRQPRYCSGKDVGLLPPLTFLFRHLDTQEPVSAHACLNHKLMLCMPKCDLRRSFLSWRPISRLDKRCKAERVATQFGSNGIEGFGRRCEDASHRPD